MKKFLSLALAVLMLAVPATLAVSATDLTLTAPVATLATMPDWIITEVCPDTAGTGEVAGYSDGKDVFEYFEIYNASGKTLNLYDYCMVYNPYGRTNEMFENTIYESTPFKPGNYIDGSDFVNNWVTTAYELGDLSNMPVNPDTCMVEPGEVVVIWSLYCEPYYAMWNDGKGMSINDFRTFWNIPENVKVIAWDGNSYTVNDKGEGRGGHEKNFNIKNSGTGTYGIALYSEAVQVANALEADSTNKNDYQYQVAYTECPELAAWATVDFSQFGGSTMANMTYTYIPDLTGIGAELYGYTADARRMMLAEVYADATPGVLTPFQKMVLGVELDKGDVVDFSLLYYPMFNDKVFEGWKVNGTLYTENQTFTADAAGLYTLEYSYVDPASTTPANTEKKDETTTTVKNEDDVTTPEDTGTAAPTGTTTAPADNNTTTATPSEGGCGSVVALGLMACLIPAAVIVCRKKD